MPRDDPDTAYDRWREEDEGGWWRSTGRPASFFNEQQARKFGEVARADAIAAQRIEMDRRHALTVHE